MKYVKVHETNIKVGDVVWDIHPSKSYATRFEVVNINEDELVLKQKISKSYYHKREDGTTVFTLSDTYWYREEASND